jgi:hypothetical protein
MVLPPPAPLAGFPLPALSPPAVPGAPPPAVDPAPAPPLLVLLFPL